MQCDELWPTLVAGPAYIQAIGSDSTVVCRYDFFLAKEDIFIPCDFRFRASRWLY